MRLPVLTAALLAVVLAACGSSGDSGGGGSTAPGRHAAASVDGGAPRKPLRRAPHPGLLPPDPMGLSQKAGLRPSPRSASSTTYTRISTCS